MPIYAHNASDSQPVTWPSPETDHPSARADQAASLPAAGDTTSDAHKQDVAGMVAMARAAVTLVRGVTACDLTPEERAEIATSLRWCARDENNAESTLSLLLAMLATAVHEAATWSISDYEAARRALAEVKELSGLEPMPSSSTLVRLMSYARNPTGQLRDQLAATPAVLLGTAALTSQWRLYSWVEEPDEDDGVAALALRAPVPHHLPTTWTPMPSA